MRAICYMKKDILLFSTDEKDVLIYGGINIKPSLKYDEFVKHTLFLFVSLVRYGCAFTKKRIQGMVSRKEKPHQPARIRCESIHWNENEKEICINFHSLLHETRGRVA